MIRFYTFCIALMLSSHLSATTFESVGTIKVLSVTDSALPFDPTLYVTGLKSAGNCKVDSSGHVPIMMRSDQKGKAQFSLALAAYMSGKKIKVILNDSNRDSNGTCYMYWIGLDSSVD